MSWNIDERHELRKTDILTNMHKRRETDRKTYRSTQTDIQTLTDRDRQTDRHTQTDIQTHRQTVRRQTYTHIAC